MASEMCVKTIELRKWYKVRWKSDPAGHSGLKGKVDLLMDSQLGAVRENVELVEEIQTQTCASGVALGFGKASMEGIEEWKKRNAVRVRIL